MDCETTEGCVKKPYIRPQVQAISLRPEEAVLGHCKTPTGGPTGSVCSNFFAPCVQNVGS
jgi:hypothetical protein